MLAFRSRLISIALSSHDLSQTSHKCHNPLGGRRMLSRLDPPFMTHFHADPRLEMCCSTLDAASFSLAARQLHHSRGFYASVHLFLDKFPCIRTSIFACHSVIDWCNLFTDFAGEFWILKYGLAFVFAGNFLVSAQSIVDFPSC